jgi:hypothetical protein
MAGMGLVELGEETQAPSTCHAAAENMLVQHLENAVQRGLPTAVKSFVALCIRLSSGASPSHLENVSHLLPGTGASQLCVRWFHPYAASLSFIPPLCCCKCTLNSAWIGGKPDAICCVIAAQQTSPLVL